MNLQRIKHMLFRLSIEEKALGIGALMVIIGSFLPWYSMVLNYNEQAMSESGFSGDLGVIGFVVFILVIISLAFLMSEHLNFRLPGFGFKKEKIILFLMGENAFLLLLALAIYTKRSIDYTNAELRFGLYLSLIGAFIGTFSAYSQIQKLQKKNAQEFFDLPGDGPSGPEPEPEDDLPGKDVPEEEVKHIEKHTKPAHKPKQESFFEDNNESKEDTCKYEEGIEAKKDDESYFEDETKELIGSESAVREDIDLGINDDDIHNISDIKNNDEEEKQLGQGSYFLKDAGVHKQPTIKVDIASIKPVEKNINIPEISAEGPVAKNEPAVGSEAQARGENEKLSFYDDL